MTEEEGRTLRVEGGRRRKKKRAAGVGCVAKAADGRRGGEAAPLGLWRSARGWGSALKSGDGKALKSEGRLWLRKRNGKL